jgi:hypothetical protein
MYCLILNVVPIICTHGRFYFRGITLHLFFKNFDACTKSGWSPLYIKDWYRLELLSSGSDNVNILNWKIYFPASMYNSDGVIIILKVKNNARVSSWSAWWELQFTSWFKYRTRIFARLSSNIQSTVMNSVMQLLFSFDWGIY